MSPSSLDTMTSQAYVTADMTTEAFWVENTTDNNNTDPPEPRDEALAKMEIAVLSTILYMALFGNGIVLAVLNFRYQQLSKMQWFIAHLAVADSTILYMALFGNGIVLAVLKFRYQQLSRMQWFIAHLAIADVFVALFHVMPQLIWDITYQFNGNDFLCRAVMLFQVIAMCASSFVLVMTAIDRYISICHPLTSQTLSPSRVHQMSALAWVLSILFSLPQVFIFKLQEVDGLNQCFADFVPGWGLQAYVTYMFLVVYVIPCSLLTFCYGRICLKVWESIAFKELSSSFRQSNKERTSSLNGNRSFRLRVSFKRMQDRETVMSSDQQQQQCDVNYPIKRAITPPRKPPGKRMQKVSNAKIRTVKMTLAVVLTYLICWAPFFVMNMVSVFGEVDFNAPYMVIIMLLASLNSCTNPWIYLLFSGRVCSRRKERAVSRSYNTSTQLTYACDALESTATNTTSGGSMLLHPHRSSLNKGQGHSQVVLKDRRSSWRQLEPIQS